MKCNQPNYTFLLRQIATKIAASFAFFARPSLVVILRHSFIEVCVSSDLVYSVNWQTPKFYKTNSAQSLVHLFCSRLVLFVQDFNKCTVIPVHQHA